MRRPGKAITKRKAIAVTRSLKAFGTIPWSDGYTPVRCPSFAHASVAHGVTCVLSAVADATVWDHPSRSVRTQLFSGLTKNLKYRGILLST